MELRVQCSQSDKSSTMKVFKESLDSINFPILISDISTQSDADRAWSAVKRAAKKPLQAALAKYKKNCTAAFLIAKRRDIAALNIDFRYVDFIPYVSELNNLPPSVRALAASSGSLSSGKSADDVLSFGDGGLGMTTSLSTTLMIEWQNLISSFRVNTSISFLTQDSKSNPCNYWLKIRDSPGSTMTNIASVMLYWLAFPVGSCGLERDFSGMSIVSRSARRRRMKFKSFRATVLSHVYKADLQRMLDRQIGV